MLIFNNRNRRKRKKKKKKMKKKMKKIEAGERAVMNLHDNNLHAHQSIIQ